MTDAAQPQPPPEQTIGCPFEGCWNDCAVFDGLNGEPVACLDHIDDVLQRLEAIALHPGMREQLPALYDPVP